MSNVLSRRKEDMMGRFTISVPASMYVCKCTEDSLKEVAAKFTPLQMAVLDANPVGVAPLEVLKIKVKEFVLDKKMADSDGAAKMAYEAIESLVREKVIVIPKEGNGKEFVFLTHHGRRMLYTIWHPGLVTHLDEMNGIRRKTREEFTPQAHRP